VNVNQTRVLFYSAAVFNWAACLVFLEPLGIARLLNLSHSVGGAPFDQVALMAIALFGLGYWMVGANPGAHRGIVILGLIGKLGVVAIMFSHYFFIGDVNFNVLGLVSGDLIYSVLFYRFLRSPIAAPERE
jgi:hypothetical protein